MSRGPGRVERAIRSLLDVHPDEAFTTDELCAVCYDLSPQGIERKHRNAVVRAANKLYAADPDWCTRWAWQRGHTLIVYNAASLASVAMLRAMYFGANWVSREELIQRAQHELHPPEGCSKWARRDAADLRQRVASHIAYRDGTPEARAQIEAQREAELEALWGGLRKATQKALHRPKVLSTTPRSAVDNIYRMLAAKARALTAQNDPDAVRAGLAEIADALDAVTAGNADE